MEIVFGATRVARAQTLQIEAARGRAAVEALDDCWDALVLQQSIPNPTLLAAWQRELAAVDGWDPLLLRVFDGRKLVAGGLFARRRQRGLMRAAWAGGSWHDFSPDVLAAPGRWDAAETLIEALFDHADVVSLVTVADGVLARAVAQATPYAVVEERPGTYVVELPPPTLQKFLAKVHYDERRAGRAGVAVGVDVLSEPDAVAPALERLFRLHRERSRERDPRIGHFSGDRATRAANRRGLGALAAAGCVRISEVFENDQLVASTMVLVAGDAAVGNVKAMRKGRGLHSPGRRGIAAIVERLVADGVRVLDVGGSEGPLERGEPKDGLSPTARPFVAIHVSNKPLFRRALPVAFAARSRLRRS